MTLEASRLRRLAGGISLIAAPAAFAIGTFTHPGLRSKASEQLALIAEHPDAWYVTHLLGLAFVVLMTPAVLTLLHLVRPEDALLGHVGTGLALVGLAAWAGVVAIFGWVWWHAARAGDPAEMASLVERYDDAAGSALPSRALSFALLVGMLLLAVALVRSAVVPRFAAPLAVMGLAQFAIGAQAEELWLMNLGTTLMTLGLGTIGVAVLRWSDERWLGAMGGAGFEPA